MQIFLIIEIDQSEMTKGHMFSTSLTCYLLEYFKVISLNLIYNNHIYHTFEY